MCASARGNTVYRCACSSSLAKLDSQYHSSLRCIPNSKYRMHHCFLHNILYNVSDVILADLNLLEVAGRSSVFGLLYSPLTYALMLILLEIHWLHQCRSRLCPQIEISVSVGLCPFPIYEDPWCHHFMPFIWTFCVQIWSWLFGLCLHIEVNQVHTPYGSCILWLWLNLGDMNAQGPIARLSSLKPSLIKDKAILGNVPACI